MNNGLVNEIWKQLSPQIPAHQFCIIIRQIQAEGGGAYRETDLLICKVGMVKRMDLSAGG